MSPRGLTAVVALILIMASDACAPPHKPTNVSAEAVWVESAKTGYWKACVFDGSRVYCTIWNERGSVLKDEPFLPLDGGQLPRGKELRMRSTANAGPYDVYLENGRLLVPESMLSQYRERYGSPH